MIINYQLLLINYELLIINYYLFIIDYFYESLMINATTRKHRKGLPGKGPRMSDPDIWESRMGFSERESRMGYREKESQKGFQ